MAQGASAGGSGHLPKRRPEGAPPAQLPRQRKGTTPQLYGRYPDYDVLTQAGHWDQATREVVLARVREVPRLRFFSASEERVLRAFCDVVMAQDEDPKVPVLEMVDAKLFEGRLDGFRHHDMPPDPQTWRLVAAKLDEEARKEGWEGFAAAGHEAQCRLVDAFAKGRLEWPELPCKKAFGVVMRGVLSEFYSHPWAWNEIGFGGPAYPRGFARLSAGQREHWEAPPEFELDPVKDVHERGLE